MRVIAGTAKGIRLEIPKGLDIRPTLDRVREALFSILAPRLEGARFLDLFAGTGANGIEALSRGAAWCTFADNAPAALAAIARNLEVARLSGRAERLELSLPGDIRVLANRAKPYDIVFADPPHTFAAHEVLLEQIQANHILAGGGVVVVEHATRAALDVAQPPSAVSGLSCSRRATYGDTTLSFFA